MPTALKLKSSSSHNASGSLHDLSPIKHKSHYRTLWDGGPKTGGVHQRPIKELLCLVVPPRYQPAPQAMCETNPCSHRAGKMAPCESSTKSRHCGRIFWNAVAHEAWHQARSPGCSN